MTISACGEQPFALRRILGDEIKWSQEGGDAEMDRKVKAITIAGIIIVAAVLVMLFLIVFPSVCGAIDSTVRICRLYS